MAERKPRITLNPLALIALQHAAEHWPEGTAVRQESSDRDGVVRMDNPGRIPGWVAGAGPTAWCLTSGGSVLVCVRWETDLGIPLVVWTLLNSLTRTSNAGSGRPS